ncbi:hypothetical protein R3W88_033359 [Solanum pinnatisectum]|uniref:UBN2 domain-containing protein n=1 Tax=Solanum pinnatisectum TaxID=50273 RepID=A0AAV9K1L5_9SOLN|nr:hypothetical protein R3W88_033359 [Solanum pinnatisectum]
MSHLNHLSSIFNQNKLEGPNYGFKYVLVEECPIEPTDATDEEIKSYDKLTSMKSLLTTKMVDGSPVKDHMLNMMIYLNELEILDTSIDKES